MLPLKEKDKPIVQKLLSAGCCARCILRFCCVRVQAAYRQPQQAGLLTCHLLKQQIPRFSSIRGHR
uniref:Uncharacterized protein n=1 Tax=Seriola lalandi dorsalis TaxID=1841481 RepID=A0A3B4X223_SERLL